MVLVSSTTVNAVANEADYPKKKTFDTPEVTSRSLIMPREAQSNKTTAKKLTECPRGKYSGFIAEMMANCAGWSYADIDDFKDIIAPKYRLQGEIKELVVQNDALLIKATCQMIRTSDKKTMIITFRGTEPTNILNWVCDASCKQVEAFNGMKVHQGFLNNTEAVWYGFNGVRAHLEKPKMMAEDFKYGDTVPVGDRMDADKLEAIYICGHSLGGAMAQVAAMALQDECPDLWKKVRGVYTFGQPMVVNDWQRSECEERVGDLLFRHVFANDVVPHVPPLSAGAFDHVGKEYRYNPDKDSWILRHDGWFPLARGRATQVAAITPTFAFMAYDGLSHAINWLPGIFRSPWSAIDHSPAGYIDALARDDY